MKDFFSGSYLPKVFGFIVSACAIVGSMYPQYLQLCMLISAIFGLAQSCVIRQDNVPSENTGAADKLPAKELTNSATTLTIIERK